MPVPLRGYLTQTGHADPASAATLVDLLRWRATYQPDDLAFTFLRDGEDDEAHITYQALDRRARAIGALLQQHVPHGSRAMLLYPSGLDYITAFLGCLYAEVIAVPAYAPNPRLERTLHRLRAITADAGPAVFLTANSILPAAEPLAAREPGFAGKRWLATDTVADADANTWRQPVIGSGTLAFLQYTSGSTGTPRGVMVSHGNLMHNEALIKRVMAADDNSLAVSWLPLYHDMGLIGTVLQPLYTGFRSVLMSPAHFLASPVRWLRAITRYRATLSAAPNFAYDLCTTQITADERAGLDLSSWKVAVNGAEPVDPQTLSGFMARFGPYGLRPHALTACYGLAEATLFVTGGPAPGRLAANGAVVVRAGTAALRRGQVTIASAAQAERTSALAGSGQLQPGQHVLIVDPHTRRPLRPGEVGEIWVAGPSVARGYWNSPDATERTFRARLADSGEGPFLRTGDLGFIQNGELFVTSRLKDLIIIRGMNHAPQDIERTAQASHPALRPGCGVAFTVDDGTQPRLVIVHEVKRQYLAADRDEVAAAIRGAVAAEHELEVHAVVLVRTGSVPKTSSGKLQRQACRDQFVRGTLRTIGESIRQARELAPPQSPDRSGAVLAELAGSPPDRRLPVLVAYLRRQLATAAGVPVQDVPAGRPFTALGLDSLRLLQLKQRVETELGVAVPLDHFTDFPSPAELAQPVLDALDRTISATRPELVALPAVEPDPARVGDPFPLTDIQQAYWIGRGSAYEVGDVSVHAYVEVQGSGIDLPRLEESWQRLVARHDMLRAVVLPEGRQRILPSVPHYQIQVTDLRGQSQKQAGDTLAALRQEMSHQVLTAEEWPGFDLRATLLDGQRTRVHISIDLLHIDGGSLMILIDEWMRLYQDTAASLPPLELSYRDYALGEIALRDTDVYRRSARYWQDRAAALPPAPVLPAARRRQAGQPTRFRRRGATLEPRGWQRLKACAAQAGLTPSAVLLTAYTDVIRTWSEDDAFTLNVTLFNRLPLHPQVNRILGDFTSMVFAQAPPLSGTSFEQRCARMQRELWAGLEHRHVSGIRVLRDLARAHNRTTGALMPVVFTSMIDLAAQGFRPPLPSLRALGEVVYSLTQTPQVWLDHQVLEEDGALALTWDCAEDHFPPGLLDDMFAAYTGLLAGLAEDEAAWRDRGRTLVPHRQLADRAALNATDSPLPDETLLTLFLRQAAAARADCPAVITPARTLTYAGLLRQAGRLARNLRARGARPGTLVAVVMDKGWEQVAATLGIHLAGCAYLPVDPGLPAERRQFLLADGQVRFAVTQPWLDHRLEWPAGVERVRVDATPAPDDSVPEPVQGPADLSHVIYTSGSTGVPKGVMLEHRNVVNRIADVNQRLGVGPGDRILALSALHHDLSVYDIFGILAAGAAMVIPDAGRIKDPGHWTELMVRHHVTMWNSVPAFLEMLVEYLERHAGQPDLMPGSLRCAVLAGDWIPVSLPDRLRHLVDGAQVIASGGPTETTIWDIWYPVGKVDPAWPSIPYGKPMNNTRYHVLNRALLPCPVWVAGELYIAGAGLARGYWRDEDRTRERFITHPQTGERLYRSGDMGRYLPDGNIEFLGRQDLQVKIRGQRIELGEIEATLKQHPGVRTAAVVAAGAAEAGVAGGVMAGGECRALTRLVAYVVPATGGSAADGKPASGGKDNAAFTPEQLSGISVVDPVARIEFKLSQCGIRKHDSHETVALPHPEPDEALRRAYTERVSVRDFSAGPLPLPAFGELLRSLTQIDMDGTLPKYRYPSGGGLYPVQTYVYVKPGRVADLAAGVYYHDPKRHRLVLLSPGGVLDASTQMPHNRAIFDAAAFIIVLIGQLAAVEPLYGGLARDFCLLEAGYMGQLLMSVAPSHQIGLCAIGAMDFERVRHLFDLDDSHILVHLLVGGGLTGDPGQSAGPRAAGHPPGATAPAGEGLAGELRDFLRSKLPEHMRPTEYVTLSSLPLTANGKLDRKLLPSPGTTGLPSQPADAPPRSAAERTLAAIARKVLQAGDIGIHQNFFDLGGDSVHMVKILNEVRAEFRRDVPVTEIFRHPTISSLAAYLSEESVTRPAGPDSDERAGRRRAALARRGPDCAQRPAGGAAVSQAASQARPQEGAGQE